MTEKSIVQQIVVFVENYSLVFLLTQRSLYFLRSKVLYICWVCSHLKFSYKFQLLLHFGQKCGLTIIFF